MKHFKTLLLALGVASASMSAQNVTVLMKDGTSHKYNADYISEITFPDASSEIPVVDFKQLSLEAFSGGNVTINLINEEENISLTLDAYGPKDAKWLTAGTYTVASTCDEWTIDSNTQYTYLTEATGKTNITAGTMTISVVDRVYTIEADVTLEGGRQFKGKWSGTPSTYTPWIDATLDKANYNENPQPAGQFYVRFSDPDWKYEMAMVFIASQDAKTLPAGTYTYAESGAAGTLSPASYVDTYNPNANMKLMEGSKITVAEADGTYIINMELNLNDGRTAQFDYEGQISGTPAFDDPVVEPEIFDTLEMDLYGAGAHNIVFVFGNSADHTRSLSLDTYGSSDDIYLQPGTFTIGDGYNNKIHTSVDYTFLAVDGQKTAITGGQMTISRDGEIYTFDIDFTLADDTKLVAKYVGKVPKFGPMVTINPDAAAYNTNPHPAGNFYVKMNDTNYQFEMALDFFADPAATLLPAGEYTYSADNTPGTFGPKSYVDTYNPQSNNRMTEGSKVNVAVDGETYTITMNLNFEDGRTAEGTYTGTISGTPQFEGDVVEPEIFDTLEMDLYGAGAHNIVFVFGNSADHTRSLSLDTYGNSNDIYLHPGTFTIGNGYDNEIHPSVDYTFLAVDGQKTAITGGQMTISRDGEIYTFDIDFTLADDTKLVAKYVGKVPKFGPMVTINPDAAAYNTNPHPAGNFYVKMNDTNYKFEMALDFFADPTATLLPAGEYTYSADNAPGTFGPKSYVDTYNPQSNNRMTEGSKVNVAVDGETYTITMNLNFEDGRTAEGTYTGTISGTPVFE